MHILHTHLHLQVLQDFQLLFGEETSSELLRKWETFLKTIIIKEARNLTKTLILDSLIHAAEENPDEDAPRNFQFSKFSNHFYVQLLF